MSKKASSGPRRGRSQEDRLVAAMQREYRMPIDEARVHARSMRSNPGLVRELLRPAAAATPREVMGPVFDDVLLLRAEGDVVADNVGRARRRTRTRRASSVDRGVRWILSHPDGPRFGAMLGAVASPYLDDRSPLSAVVGTEGCTRTDALRVELDAVATAVATGSYAFFREVRNRTATADAFLASIAADPAVARSAAAAFRAESDGIRRLPIIPPERGTKADSTATYAFRRLEIRVPFVFERVIFGAGAATRVDLTDRRWLDLAFHPKKGPRVAALTLTAAVFERSKNAIVDAIRRIDTLDRELGR